VLGDALQEIVQQRDVNSHVLGVEAAQRQDAVRAGLLVLGLLQVVRKGILVLGLLQIAQPAQEGPPRFSTT
jgi:hypothetical protein